MIMKKLCGYGVLLGKPDYWWIIHRHDMKSGFGNR